MSDYSPTKDSARSYDLGIEECRKRGVKRLFGQDVPQDVPKGNYAVMAQRQTSTEGLDFFPTPPWATRALMPVIGYGKRTLGTCWEPAAGGGHMAEVLREFFDDVIASDIHDYGKGYVVGSFVGIGAYQPRPADWIITNPPFNLAVEFAKRAIEQAVVGVALLTRTAWLEGGKRHDELFSLSPPHTVALFSERVPMVKGRWDPKASTATSYCWVIWRQGYQGDTVLRWIPPGRKAALTKPNDIERFGG